MGGGIVSAGANETKKDWQEGKPIAANRSIIPITRRIDGNSGMNRFFILLSTEPDLECMIY